MTCSLARDCVFFCCCFVGDEVYFTGATGFLAKTSLFFTGATTSLFFIGAMSNGLGTTFLDLKL
jgi:hypothetical protein